MLNKATSVAENLLNATVNEFNVALGNAANRLNGIPGAGAAAVATPQQVQDEADGITWATLQVFLLAGACADLKALNAAITALTPAPAAAAPASSAPAAAATPAPASAK